MGGRVITWALWGGCQEEVAPIGSDPSTPAGHSAAPSGTSAHTGSPEPSGVLVVPDGDGLTFFGLDGAVVWNRTWTELAGPCEQCGGEGASVDGDGLLVAFTTRGTTSGGAVARLSGTGELEWRLEEFSFPHGAERDPVDGSVLVVETSGARVVWVEGDGQSTTAVRTLDRDTPGWFGEAPNGVERFDWDGRSYLLFSHRGRGPAFPTGPDPSGALSLWDITTPGDYRFVWRFPETGGLAYPHGAVLRTFDGHLWLVYAHSAGLLWGSSIGLAWADDPTRPPRYVADVETTGPTAPLDFLRGVELTEDGQVWLTDSGPGGGASASPDGRLLWGRLPTGLEPSGATGRFQDQTVVSIEPELLVSGLVNPFEGWLWDRPWP